MSVNARKMTVFVLITLLALVAVPAMAQDICGMPHVATLTAGQTTEVGTVTVSNDATTLYVKYETNDNWLLTEVHLYVLNTEPTERLPPGQAPYKDDIPDGIQSYTFEVPLAELDFGVTCGETQLWLQAHAVVEMVGGEPGESETAYGGPIVPSDQGSWYGNIAYKVQCCGGEEPQKCFEDETAWADGDRYVQRGNWATYTSYEDCLSGVTLYAGQTLEAGTVTCAPVNDSVEISICLNEGWRFNPDEPENVKIQDYGAAPSDNPSPGQFDHKGYATDSCFDITVPTNEFYGVHVDVQQEVECPVE